MYGSMCDTSFYCCWRVWVSEFIGSRVLLMASWNGTRHGKFCWIPALVFNHTLIVCIICTLYIIFNTLKEKMEEMVYASYNSSFPAAPENDNRRTEALAFFSLWAATTTAVILNCYWFALLQYKKSLLSAISFVRCASLYTYHYPISTKGKTTGGTTLCVRVWLHVFVWIFTGFVHVLYCCEWHNAKETKAWKK